MNTTTSLVAFSLFIRATTFGETNHIVDFRTDRTPNGWDLGATVYNKDRGLRFEADGDAITSPTETTAATAATIVVSFTGSNSPAPSFEVLCGSDYTRLRSIGSITNRTLNIHTTNVFAFAETDNMRLLQLVARRNGNSKAYLYVVSAGFGTFEPAAPPPTPQSAGPVRLSLQAGSQWTETFDACTNLFPKSGNLIAWANDETLGPWQAFQDGLAPASLRRNAGAMNSEGLYAYWATGEVASYSLGMNVGSKAHTAVFGVAFTNDTPLRLSHFALAYTGRQFGVKNTVEQTLAVEWLTTNALAGIDAPGPWRAVPALTFTTPATSTNAPPDGLPEARQSAPLAGLHLPPGEILLLRWRRDRVTNVAAIGIDDIRLTWNRPPQSSVIIIR